MELAHEAPSCGPVRLEQALGHVFAFESCQELLNVESSASHTPALSKHISSNVISRTCLNQALFVVAGCRFLAVSMLLA